MLSSGTNAIIGFLIARHSSPSQFGAFTLIYTAYLIAFGLSQAIVAWPLMVQFGSCPRSMIKRKTSACLGLAFIVGAASCILFGIIAANISILDNDLSLIMTIALPFLIIQATWRSQYFAEGYPKGAFCCDAIWAAIQFSIYAVLLMSSMTLTPNWVLFSWALGGSLAGCIFCIVRWRYPNIRKGIKYLLEYRHLCVRFGAEYSVTQSANYSLPYILVGILNASVVGFIRAGQLLLGLLNIPLMGIAPLLAKRGTRIFAQSPTRLTNFAARNAIAGAALIIPYVLILNALPESVGTNFLGRSWLGAHQVIVPLGIASLAVWVQWAGINTIHIRKDSRVSFRLGIIGAIATISGTIVGASAFGLMGAVWAIAVSSSMVTIMVWTVVLRYHRNGSRSQINHGVDLTGAELENAPAYQNLEILEAGISSEGPIL